MNRLLCASAAVALLCSAGAAAASTVTISNYVYAEASASDSLSNTSLVTANSGLSVQLAGQHDTFGTYDAYALANYGVQRVSASVAASDASALLGQDLSGDPLLANVGRSAGSTALVVDHFTPSANAHATANVYFDRTVFADVVPDQQLLNNLLAAAPAGAELSMIASVTADLSVYICDATSGCSTLQQAFALTYLNLASGTRGGFPIDDASLYDGVSYSYPPPLPAAAAAQSGTAYQRADLITFDLDLIAGHTYEVYVQADCLAQLMGPLVYSLGSSASCDAAHSTYWNGLTNITDPNGAPLPGFSVSSVSGFNYLYADPAAPFPSSTPPSAVPEPSAWAVLIAGLALMGAFLRAPRRRGRLSQA